MAEYEFDEDESYVLAVPRFRDVHKFMTPKGDVLHESRRFFKGDSLDELDSEKVERLVRLGAAEPEGAAAEREAEAEALAEAEAEAVAEAADDADASDTDAEPPAGDEGQGDGTEPSGDAPQPVDYSGWEYGDLQKAAKERTGNGGGSKDDLVERLTAQDQADAAAPTE